MMFSSPNDVSLKNDSIWRPHKNETLKSSFLSQFKSKSFNSFFLWNLKIHTFERIISHEHLACARAAIFCWNSRSLNLSIWYWVTLTEKMFKKDASWEWHFHWEWTPMLEDYVKEKMSWIAFELTIFTAVQYLAKSVWVHIDVVSPVRLN